MKVICINHKNKPAKIPQKEWIKVKEMKKEQLEKLKDFDTWKK